MENKWKEDNKKIVPAADDIIIKAYAISTLTDVQKTDLASYDQKVIANSSTFSASEVSAKAAYKFAEDGAVDRWGRGEDIALDNSSAFTFATAGAIFAAAALF